MQGYRNRFYLYDRWFNLVKETDEKISYTSGKKNSKVKIQVEIEKKENTINILYLQEKKLIAKLELKDVGSKKVKLHYQEQEPQQIIINDNTYVNLLLEMFTTIEDDRLVNKRTVKIKKKKKLNKMCYLEPTFPIDKEIDYRSIDIESDVLDYFIKLIDYIKHYLKDMQNLAIEPTKSEEDAITREYIKNLDIPSDMYIYDRNYSFVGKDDNTLYYQNSDDGITDLAIKIDPNKYLSSILFTIKDTYADKNSKLLFQIIRNELGGVTVRFSNRKKSRLRISNIDYDKVRYSYVSVFDKDHKQLMNNLDIATEKGEYSLTSHPYFSTCYIDEYGKDYRIASSEFSKLDGMTAFSSGIFNNIENVLTKKL